jgi:membrane-associated phospholipid phosphatase
MVGAATPVPSDSGAPDRGLEAVASRCRRRALGWVSADAIVCVVGFAAIYSVTVRTLPGRLVGDQALRGALLTQSIVAGQVARVLDVVSIASLLGAAVVITVIALARLRRTAGLAAVGILIGANATTQLLKIVLPRPDLGVTEVTPATLNSMPSGHTTAVLSAAVGLLFVAPARWRTGVGALAACCAAVTAVATMTAGWHRAGDGVAAFFVVGVWTAVAVAALVVVDGPSMVTQPPGSRLRADRWWWLTAAASLAAAAAITAALPWGAGLRDALPGEVMAFAAAVLAIVATAFAVTWSVVAMLRLADQLGAPVSPA